MPSNLYHIAAAAILSSLSSAASVTKVPPTDAQHAGAATTHFAAFVQKHGRAYKEGTAEYDSRRALFEKRLEESNHWNSRPNRLWEAGVNHLSDWTESELKSLRGLRPVATGRYTGGPPSFLQVQSSRASLMALPEDRLWNTASLAQVENQGQCGSCWAVAAAKMAETNHAIHTGDIRSFSAQQFVDCVPNPRTCGGKGGCDGATVELAMLYMANQGLTNASETPYTGTDSKCKAPAKTAFLQEQTSHMTEAKVYGFTMEELTSPGVKKVESSPATQAINFLSWERLPENQYEPLMMALMDGVVAVSVGASQWAWYKGGVFDGCDRDAEIDHAVVATGFGVDRVKRQKFWRILNSWGGEWGEDGSIRLLRTDSDGQQCGTDYHPEAGTGCKGGPKQVKVCGACGVLYDNVVARFGGQETSFVQGVQGSVNALANLLVNHFGHH